MDRRTFLTTLAASSLLPDSLLIAFQQAGAGNAKAGVLLPSLAIAGALGKPLLVLLGPKAPAASQRKPSNTTPRQAEIDTADLFDFGGERIEYGLALCEVCGSTSGHVSDWIGGHPGEFALPENTWAVLIEPRRGLATGPGARAKRVIALTASMEPRPNLESLAQPHKSLEAARSLIAQRVQARARELAQALIGSPNRLALRAAQARTAIGPEAVRSALQALSRLNTSDPALSGAERKAALLALDKGAAVVLHSAPNSAPVQKSLHVAADFRLWNAGPTGSTWAKVTACDTKGGRNFPFGGTCAKGSTPAGSWRLLLYDEHDPSDWTPPPTGH